MQARLHTMVRLRTSFTRGFSSTPLARKFPEDPSEFFRHNTRDFAYDLTPIANRPSLINDDLGREYISRWGIDKMHDVTVVDMYSGVGTLSKQLLELPNVRRVIAMENGVRFDPFLNALAEKYPDRFIHHKMDPFQWEAHNSLESLGYLSHVPVVPWEEEHPSLFFTGQLSVNRYGDQLLVQLLLSMVDRLWLYKFGRVRMGLLGNDTLWSKLSAHPGDKTYHKLAAVLSLICRVEKTPTNSPLSPVPGEDFIRTARESIQFSGASIVPHAQPRTTDFELFEFITLKMFINKTFLWENTVKSVAIGAENLVPIIRKNGVPTGKLRVIDLSIDQWLIIVDAFKRWPFLPQHLMDVGADMED